MDLYEVRAFYKIRLSGVKMKKRVRLAMLFVGIVIFSIFIAMNSAWIGSKTFENAIALKGEDFTPSLSAVNFKSPGLKELTYEIEIHRDSFSMDEATYGLVLFRLADNGHRIIFNDITLGESGDFKEGDSNLWNGLFVYAIDSSLLQDLNTLKIETVASYRTGLSSTPILIMPMSQAMALKSRMSFFGEQNNTVMIGFIYFSSIITFIFYLINGYRNRTYLLISMATFLTGIYYSNYLSFTMVGISYLMYKKIIMTSLYVSIACYTYVIGRYFKKNWLDYLGHVTITGALLIAVVSQDMVLYKQLYSLWYLIILIDIAAWIYVCVQMIKESDIAYIFLISFLTLICYGGITVFMDLMGAYFSFNSPVVAISVLSLIPLLLIYESLNEKEEMLINEKKMREEEITNSLTDNLTGIWNQRYMQMMFNENVGHYVMVLLDIDNFKRINDTYGHLAGDYILREVAQILRDHLRKSDVICRYGGDEFVMMMYECPLEQGYKIIDKLRKYIEHYPFEYEEIKIDLTISAGIIESTGDQVVELIFNDADTLLYKAKSNGKNSIAMINTHHVVKVT